MRRVVLVEIHEDDDPEETADLWRLVILSASLVIVQHLGPLPKGVPKGFWTPFPFRGKGRG